MLTSAMSAPSRVSGWALVLHVRLAQDDLTVEPLAERHREALRAACAEDQDIWEIYPVCYAGEQFDVNFDLMISTPRRQSCAIRRAGQIVGMTAWLDADTVNRSVEIGNSYIVPRLRSTGFNTQLKKLMIEHAIAEGFYRIAFKVDERNKRSQAAVLKLGAQQEGVLRADRVTWTGHVRNTVIFSILADEWKR